MTSASRFIVLLPLFLALAAAVSLAQTVGHYEGDTLGDNRDYWANLGLGRAVVAPSCLPPALSVPGVSLVVSGCTGPQQWVPVLAIGHAVHQGPGPVVLKVRTTCVNGPAVPGVPAMNVTEVLIGGPLLASIPGSHDGSFAVFSVPVPCDPALVGLAWAAQATVGGGGFADLSTAIHGVIG